MTVIISFVILMVGGVLGDDPIIKVTPGCASSMETEPRLSMTADVPAYALARCKNGDQDFVTLNDVDFYLSGSLDQNYTGDNCQFYKKRGSNTFTVEVEVGWGEKGSHVITHTDISTISCAYDQYGKGLSDTERIAEWYLNPREHQTLLGGDFRGKFELAVIDVLGERILTDHISIGRKIRLKATATSHSGQGFRALSCVANNGKHEYPVLRAGCGDGLIFGKTEGFQTEGNTVFSPYFDAFKLQGADGIRFHCEFAACLTNCDGDSCETETRLKRSIAGDSSQQNDQLTKTRPEHTML